MGSLFCVMLNSEHYFVFPIYCHGLWHKALKENQLKKGVNRDSRELLKVERSS